MSGVAFLLAVWHSACNALVCRNLNGGSVVRENKLTVKALALLLFLGLPFAVQAQSAPSCTPLVENCGPAPIPPDIQQREQQIDRQFQADAPPPLEQQLSAQQQAFEQQQALFAQQDQARAEQDQANTLWQEQMNQDQGQSGTPAGAAVLGAAQIGEALIVRHEREEKQQQDMRALDGIMQQNQALMQQIQAQDTMSARLDSLLAEAAQDHAVEQAAATDLESIEAVWNAQTEKMRQVTTCKQQLATCKQLLALSAQGAALKPRADADAAKINAAERDLARIRQQVDALSPSKP